MKTARASRHAQKIWSSEASANQPHPCSSLAPGARAPRSRPSVLRSSSMSGQRMPKPPPLICQLALSSGRATRSRGVQASVTGPHAHVVGIAAYSTPTPSSEATAASRRSRVHMGTPASNAEASSCTSTQPMPRPTWEVRRHGRAGTATARGGAPFPALVKHGTSTTVVRRCPSYDPTIEPASRGGNGP
jgi:hypothetical protein